MEVTTYPAFPCFHCDEHRLAGCAVWDATDLGEQKKGEAQQKPKESLLKSSPGCDIILEEK